MKKILVTGINGQLGYEINKVAEGLGEVIGTDRGVLDLSNPNSIIPFIDSVKPDIIVNTAAYTAVDLAENEYGLANAVNNTSPVEMAKAAKKHNALFIHFSTDYVFNGMKTLPYTEEDIEDPLNAYGMTKLLGERGIKQVGGRNLIFRTSWLYSWRGANFFLTMINLCKNRDQLFVVNDQYGAPTYCPDIALAIKKIINRYINNKDSFSSLYGIYNMTASGRTTWFNFAEEIFFHYKNIVDPNFIPPILTGIPSSEYKALAKRPLNSMLSHQKIKKNLLIDLPDWRKGIKKGLVEICKN